MLIASIRCAGSSAGGRDRLHRQLSRLPDRVRARTVDLGSSRVAPTAPSMLRQLAELVADAEEAGEAFAVVADDLLVADTPLLSILDDPRPSCRALVDSATPGLVGQATYGVLVSGNRLTSVQTVEHQLPVGTTSSASFLGLLVLGTANLTDARLSWLKAAEVAEDRGWSGDFDTVQYALLALVRSGIALTPVRVEPFLGGRVSQEEAAASELLRRIEQLDEPDLVWRDASRGGDGLYSTFVLRPISRRLTRQAVRAGLSPNQVTVTSLLIGLAAAWLVSLGGPVSTVTGALLLQISLLIDCVDGEVARSTRGYTAIGAWADLSSDRVKEYATLAALAIAASRAGDDVWLLALAAMVLQTLRHMQDYAFADTVLPWWRRPIVDRRPIGETGPARLTAARTDAVQQLTPGSHRVVYWAKQAIHAQIGERWLVLTVALLLGGPRGALVSYLVLVGLAELWTLTGWTLRTLTGSDRGVLLPRPVIRLLARLRDDGLLARPMRRRPRQPLGWLLPPAVTALEGAVLIVVTARTAPGALPLAYAWFAVVAWHRYDIFYRSRTGRVPVPGVVGHLAGGWLLRSLAIVALGVTGPKTLTLGLGLGCLWLAVVTIPESLYRAIRSARPPARAYADAAPLTVPQRLMLLRRSVRRWLSVPTTRLLMTLLRPRRVALVAGLPDSEENALATTVGLVENYHGEVYLVAGQPEVTRQLLARVAALLGRPAAEHQVRVVKKAGLASYLLFVRAELVFYTHGLYDSPRPRGRRLHTNLWHGTGPKWNANANMSQRIGAQAHSASSLLWGTEAVRALSMRPSTRIVAGNPRQDVSAMSADRTVCALLDLDPGRPVVLWMPTFRASDRAGLVGLRDGVRLSGSTGGAFARAADRHGVQLVAKPHRLDADQLSVLGVRVLSTEEILAAGLTLYQLVGVADGMISDYSSVWVDYLELGRSIGLYLPDLSSYERSRGLNRPGLRAVASGLVLTETNADEFFADVAAGRCFAAAAQRRLRTALSIPDVPRGQRTTRMLTDLRALGEERFGYGFGLMSIEAQVRETSS